MWGGKVKVRTLTRGGKDRGVQGGSRFGEPMEHHICEGNRDLPSKPALLTMCAGCAALQKQPRAIQRISSES